MPIHMIDIASYHVVERHFSELLVDAYSCKNVVVQVAQHFYHGITQQFKELQIRDMVDVGVAQLFRPKILLHRS